MLVEEVPKKNKTSESTVYFSSSVSLSARPSSVRNIDRNQEDGEEGNRLMQSRPKVNYNLNHLMNAQTNVVKEDGPLKSTQRVQLERHVSKRIRELNKETKTSFDIPKNFSLQSVNASADKKRGRQGNTPTTKRILATSRTLNQYFEEERNLLYINKSLSINFLFIEEESPPEPSNKRRALQSNNCRSKLRLCCICGLSSGYTRCGSCGLYTCSVKCGRIHEELRCN